VSDTSGLSNNMGLSWLFKVRYYIIIVIYFVHIGIIKLLPSKPLRDTRIDGVHMIKFILVSYNSRPLVAVLIPGL